MNIQDLLIAISEAEDAPCEKFNCSMRAKCAEGLACSAYAYYVESGRSIHPGNKVTARKVKGKERVEFGETPEPTAEVFDAVQHDLWRSTPDQLAIQTGVKLKRVDAAMKERFEGWPITLDNWLLISPARADAMLKRAAR
jgi:hypothetical protein